jgi:DedD protein
MSDRALKERIIGAVVLVIFAVLVVPVFLDGPSEEQETVSESVTLPGQNNQNRTQQTVVLDRDRSQPVPASRTPTPATSTAEERPEPVSKPPVETPQEQPAEKTPVVAATEAPVTEPAAQPAPSSTTGMWAVQLGSFANQDNANRLAASLRDQGYAAFISELQTDSGALHRVRVGPQKDRDSAEAIAVQLGKSGHNGRAVPHP